MKHTRRMKKFIAMTLSLCMVLGMMPAMCITAAAADPTVTATTAATQSQKDSATSVTTTQDPTAAPTGTADPTTAPTAAPATAAVTEETVTPTTAAAATEETAAPTTAAAVTEETAAPTTAPAVTEETAAPTTAPAVTEEAAAPTAAAPAAEPETSETAPKTGDQPFSTLASALSAPFAGDTLTVTSTRTTPLDFTTGTGWQTGCTQSGTTWTHETQHWSYDTATSTLTLSGVNFDCSAVTDCPFAIALPAGATINVKDGTTNTVSGGHGLAQFSSLGVLADTGTTIFWGTYTYDSATKVYSATVAGAGSIIGTGTLNVKAAGFNTPEKQVQNILFAVDTLTIGDKTSKKGPVLKGVSGNLSGKTGASLCAENVTMYGGSADLQTGDVSSDTSSNAIGIEGALTMMAGTFKVTAGKAAAVSKTTNAYSMAIGQLTDITGGKVTAIAGDAVVSYGIEKLGNSESTSSSNYGITDGVIYATGMTGAIQSALTMSAEGNEYNDMALAAKGAATYNQPVSALTESYQNITDTDRKAFYMEPTYKTEAKTVEIAFVYKVAYSAEFSNVKLDNGDNFKVLLADEDGTVSIPAVSNWGDYTFAGWYTAADDTFSIKKVADASATSMTVDHNMSIWALWKDASGILVTSVPLNFVDSNAGKINWRVLCTAPADGSTLWVSKGFGWSYDTASKVLTLNNAVIDASYSTDTAYAVEGADGFTIKLAEGSTNVIKSGYSIEKTEHRMRSIAIETGTTDSTSDSHGIYISGNGTLNVYSSDLSAEYSTYALISEVFDSIVTIGTFDKSTYIADANDHPTVNAYAGDAIISRTLQAAGQEESYSTGSSDAPLQKRTCPAYSTVAGVIKLANGDVNVYAGKAQSDGEADSIGVDKTAFILSGTLHAYANTAATTGTSAESMSIGCDGVAILGGSVTATAQTAQSSYGIGSFRAYALTDGEPAQSSELPAGTTIYAAGTTCGIEELARNYSSNAIMTGSTTRYGDPATANLAAAYQGNMDNRSTIFTDAKTMDTTTLAKTVKMVFEPSVTFYNIIGTFADGSEATRAFAQNGQVAIPTAPTCEGYTFAGWVSEKEENGAIWAAPTVTTMPLTKSIWAESAWLNAYGNRVMFPYDLDLNNITKDTVETIYGAAWYPNGTTVDGKTYTGKVLVLDNVTILSQGENGLTVPDGTTVVLKGNNTIKADDGDYSIGLKCYTEGDNSKGLTIEGDGTLNVTAGEADSMNSLGIYSDGGLTINKGTVNAAGGEAVTGNSAGISTGYGAVTVNDGNVTATGGKIDVTDASNGSAGISAGTDFIINNGTVNATGGAATGSASSLGIMTGLSEELAGKAVFNGGTTTANGTTAAIVGKSAFTIGDAVILKTPAGATIADSTGTVVTKDGNQAETVVITAPAPSSVTPVKATFDKYKDTVGVTFALEPGDFSLVAVTENDKALAKGITYTVSGNNYTFTPGFLKQKAVGDVTFTFVMSNGTKLPVTITISDSTPVIATGLTQDQKAVTLDGNNPTQTLKVNFQPTNTTNQKLAWTSSNENVATVDENGTITPVENGTVTITATTTDGSNLKVTFTITVNMPPRIIKGMGGTWAQGGSSGLAFTSNAVFDDFVRVEVDGGTIASTNYTTKSGSTIVTLTPAYLQTLAVGEHTLGIVSKTGTAATTFTITADAGTTTDTTSATDASTTDTTVTDTSANTGDQTPFAIYCVIAMLSLFTVAALGYTRRRREE